MPHKCVSDVRLCTCNNVSSLFLIDKKLHILSRPAEADGTREAPAEGVTEEQEASPSPGTPKFTSQDKGSSNNIVAYVSVLAAVVLGLLVYVAYKWWVLTGVGC